MRWRAVLPDADRVWSSHAARALGTAAAAGFADPERRAELAEVDFGRWRGRSIEDVARVEAEALRAWFADPDGAATPHGGEDHVAVRARLRALMTEAAAVGGTTIAFTHGGLVRAAVIEAVFPGDDTSPPPPGLTGAVMWRLDVDPPSVTELSGHVAGGTVAWRLVRLNWTPSLRGAPGGGAPGGVPPIPDG